MSDTYQALGGYRGPENDDVQVDIPSGTAFDPEVAKGFENTRGAGFSDKNARRMVAGGDQGMEGPTEQEMGKLFEAMSKSEDNQGALAWLQRQWQQYIEWRNSRPAAQKKKEAAAEWQQNRVQEWQKGWRGNHPEGVGREEDYEQY